MPYMDVRLIGSQSHGKYCTGWMLAAEDAYENCPKEIRDWGIYVMVSIYQNADGETPCMPDGLIPDVAVADDPMLPYQLGDVEENHRELRDELLRTVLEHAKEGHAEIHRPDRSRTGRFMTVAVVERQDWLGADGSLVDAAVVDAEAVVERLKEYGRFLDECVK